MRKTSISLNFLIIILFISINNLFGQKVIFKEIVDRPFHQSMEVNNNLNDVLDLKNWSDSEIRTNTFKVKSIDEAKMVQSYNDNSVISLMSNNRELPLALYIRKDKADETQLTIKDRAMKILGNPSVKEEMKIINEKNFHVISSVVDDEGIIHIKLNQYYKNIIIYGGQIYIHIYKNGNFHMINGKWFDEKKYSNSQKLIGPSVNDDEFAISEPEAKKIVESVVNEDYIAIRNLSALEKKVLNKDQIITEKIYYPSDDGRNLIPALQVNVASDLLHQYKYIINASTGDVIKKQKEYCSFIPENKHLTPDGGTTANAKDLNGIIRTINVYQSGGQYYMLDVSRPMFNPSQGSLPDDPFGGILTLNANNTSPNNSNFENSLAHNSNSNNTWNSTAVSAHYNAGEAYNYYKTNHNRNSIDGKGGSIFSIINVADENGSSMDNAFWGGSAMFYGNGNTVFNSPLAKAIDVSGHELTHGVVQNTANLDYNGESGAINESMADVFGALMDRDDWKMGEDVVNPSYFPTGALRDLSNPHNGGTNLNSNGWQPANVNEQYHGSEDNGGVHINSGIPNFAFYKFATAVTKEKAEKVYYKVLTNYLTKNSDFKDLRVAVESAANDLFGSDVKNAASSAFDAVGIVAGGGTGSNSQEDIDINPGKSYIICTDQDKNGLYLLDEAGNNALSQPLSTTAIISKPSVTDDGKHIVFVGDDAKIHYIYMEYKPTIKGTESILQNNPIWRSVAISKDGSKIAALTSDQVDSINIYSFALQEWKTFPLYNPTTAQGVDLGTVLYADVMEFDYSGEWLMYDCDNAVGGNSSVGIDYWDIGFLNCWDNKNKSFGSGRIEKLFSGLDQDVSVGNPTFSKNSPYIIAFDYLDNEKYITYGANIQTGDIGVIFDQGNDLSYPTFNKEDNKIVFDYNDGTQFLAILDLESSKIAGVSNSASYFVEGAKWGVWFSNGERNLNPSAVHEAGNDIALETYLFPNPVKNILNIETKDFLNETSFIIYDVLGNKLRNMNLVLSKGNNTIDVSNLSDGQYLLRATDGKKIYTDKFILMR